MKYFLKTSGLKYLFRYECFTLSFENNCIIIIITERQKGDSEDSLDEEADDSSTRRKSSSKSVRFNTSITSITDRGKAEKEDLPSDSSDESDAETPNGIHGNDDDIDSSDSDYDDAVMIREMMDTKGADQGPVEKKTKRSAKERKSGFETVSSDNTGKISTI